MVIEGLHRHIFVAGIFENASLCIFKFQRQMCLWSPSMTMWKNLMKRLCGNLGKSFTENNFQLSV